jgi:hypothetical protein
MEIRQRTKPVSNSVVGLAAKTVPGARPRPDRLGRSLRFVSTRALLMRPFGGVRRRMAARGPPP